MLGCPFGSCYPGNVQAFFVLGARDELSAFLGKGSAEAWAKAHGGEVLDFAGARAALVASR